MVYQFERLKILSAVFCGLVFWAFYPSSAVSGDTFADRLLNYQREMIKCGADMDCCQVVGKEISQLVMKEYQKCGSDSDCIHRINETIQEVAARIAAENQGAPEKNDAVKGPDMKDWPSVCMKIHQLSQELIHLAPGSKASEDFTWNWPMQPEPSPEPGSILHHSSRYNEISLEIFSLMKQIKNIENQIEIPKELVFKLTFCQDGRMDFSGTGRVDRKDSQIAYQIKGQSPVRLLIDFTVAADTDTVLGQGFALTSERPIRTRKSVFLDDFSGYLTVLGPDGDFIKASPDRSTPMRGPAVLVSPFGMTNQIPYEPTRYFAHVKLPNVAFYSAAGPVKGFVIPRCYHWPNIEFAPEKLADSLEKKQLILNSKDVSPSYPVGERDYLRGEALITFNDPDPGIMLQQDYHDGGLTRWGSTTDHGGIVISSGKDVFCDGYAVAKEGDPVLCFIHGISKVSRDESTGVYIGDKTVAFAGCRADCGAKILNGSPVAFAQQQKKEKKSSKN